MASPGADAIARLAGLLAGTRGGERPTAVELAELLWLAQHMQPAPAPAAAAPDGGRPPEDPETAETLAVDAPSGLPDPEEPENTAGTRRPEQRKPFRPPAPPVPSGAPAQRPDDRVPLWLPRPVAPGDSTTVGTHTALLAPVPPLLSSPLALQRALRPLKRRVPAPVGQELDEEATAHRIAGLHADPEWWLPVLRPTTERWLTLHLVHDSGPTMPVWQPLIRELKTALSQSCVFRTVESHALASDGTVRGPGLLEVHERSVVLLVSDCMGPQWREGPAGERWYAALRRLAARMPVAVLQPLPERLWRTTALPTATASLSAPSPAAPASAYAVDSYATRTAEPGSLPLPVLEASAPWLANWAKLVAQGARTSGSVALLGPEPPPSPVDDKGRGDVARLSPEDLVLRFRSLASPEAFRLAGHLAVGPPDLPVMRLVQAAIERAPQPRHLAEVILSGALKTVPGPPGTYAWRPGVQEVLLRTLPRTDLGRTHELLARAGKPIDRLAGVSAGDFPVAAPGGGDVTADGEPFATVLSESIRRLGGFGEQVLLERYRLTEPRRPGVRLSRAEDLRLNRPVLVHWCPDPPGPPDRPGRSILSPTQSGFIRQAQALAEVHSDHVAALRDFGVEGATPYVVTEFVDGLAFDELVRGSGPGLSFGMLIGLVRDIASGLEALHEKGLVRGRSGLDGLVLRPDGTAVITRLTLGEPEAGRTEATDLHDLGMLLHEVAFLRGAGIEDGTARKTLETLFAEVSGGLRSGAPAVRAQALETIRSPRFEEAMTLADRYRQRFALLGPPRLLRNRTTAAAPLSPDAWALLCVLLSRPGSSVPRAELADGVWDQPPAQHGRTPPLDQLVAEVRAVLDYGSLAEVDGGFAVHAPVDHIDVTGCEQLAARARSLRREGDPTAARAAVQSALDLWYGDPLDGVPGSAAEATRARLRELRVSLFVAKAELDLELGEFDRAADYLTSLLRSHPDQQDLRRLLSLAHQRRRPADEPAEPVITVEFPDLVGHSPQARRVLALTLSRLPHRPDYFVEELFPLDNGFVVTPSSARNLLSVLKPVMGELQDVLLESESPPEVHVTLWHRSPTGTEPPLVLPDLVPSAGGVLLILSPVLYTDLISVGGFADPSLFVPVPGETTHAGPVAWCCRVDLPARPDPEPESPVRGPFRTHDLAAARPAYPDRTAVVHSRPDGSLTLLDPHHPPGEPTARSTRFYDVDLTPRRSTHVVSLPGADGGDFVVSAELSWRVTDPVALVRSGASAITEHLLDHFGEAASNISRLHPGGQEGPMRQAVRDGVREWPVPGVSVSLTLRPVPAPPPGAAQQATASRRTVIGDLLAGAGTVLLGFDGPLLRLHSSPGQERQLAREIAGVLAERHRHSAAPLPSDLDLDDPLDLLRGLARHPLGAQASDLLDALEENAVTQESSATPLADALLRELHSTDQVTAVLTDNSRAAVMAYLAEHDLAEVIADRVYARPWDLTLMMPNPDRLGQALVDLGAAPSGTVFIASSVAELDAATALGVPFIGYARTRQIARTLRRAGCEHAVTSLQPLLNALRAT
ncbi:SAV_2336 N-terminal domain-related protein [Streptomyces sp. DSM 40750]|uniref:SAV_2336 N-terminal domain-related protein n=1 Tax=Streptomyces sp. DSM 40750 TaxID=2801030 RepID=UPI00214C7CD8|nr:SAV_2336 N-terminal domain-related protein [Streptomyces sp. DSM 40750]UUU21843.1 hypothetical protein JIX55_16735 [Streptomyces sp. DSM 40750]